MELKKVHIKYILLAVGLSLLIFLLIKKIPKLLIFVGLTLLSGLIVSVNYFIKIPIDFTPVFFLSIIITSAFGFGYTIFFVILSGFIPAIFFGDFKISIFVYLIVNLLVNLISIPLTLDFLVEGIILSLLYGLLIMVINGIMESNFEQQLFMNLPTFGINVVYFWKFGDILLSILQ